MAKAEKTKFIDKPIFRLILKILSIVLAALILLFSALTMFYASHSYLVYSL